MKEDVETFSNFSEILLADFCNMNLGAGEDYDTYVKCIVVGW